MRYLNVSGIHIKAFLSLVKGAIVYKYTSFRTKRKLIFVVKMQVRLPSRTKNPEHAIIKMSFNESFQRR